MTDIVGGLVKRRAELTGESDVLRARIAQIGTDLGHLDAVIRQFDPHHDIAGIRSKRPRSPDAAGRGEMSRAILGSGGLKILHPIFIANRLPTCPH